MGVHVEHGSLTAKVRSGVLWNVAREAAQLVLRLGFSVVLARLLTPREFGLMGMVGVFTGFAAIFVSLGLGGAIIQRKHLLPEHLSSALSLSLLSAGGLCILFFSASGLIAQLYNEPSLKPLIQALSFQFLLSATGLVHSALLRREMRFKDLAFIDTAAFVAGNSVAVAAAYLGAGVWSLVLNSLAYAAVNMALLWWRSGWRPHVGVSKAAVHDLWSYGKHLMGYNALNYWARNADNYLIGKYCGAADLGAYNRAYQLMLMASQQITENVVGVLFPAMSKMQDDVLRFRNALLKSHRIIALFAFPLAAGVSLLAEPLILVLFGPKWKEVIPLIRVLAWTGLGQSLSTQGLVFNSLGRPDLTFKVGAINSVIFVLSFLCGLPWGAMGVAVAYTAAWWLLVFPFSWDTAARMMGLRFWHIAWNVRGVMFATLSMLICVMGMDYWLKPLMPIIRLAVGAFSGSAAYWLVLRVFRIGAYEEAKAVIFPTFYGQHREHKE